MPSNITEYEGSQHALGHGYVALWIVTAAACEGKTLRPLLAAAVSDHGQRIVHAAQLGVFLKHHAGSTIVCYDAARLHWTLHQHFQASADSDAARILWTFSRTHRLHDVGLFDQLLTLAEQGHLPPRDRPLLEIAGDCGITVDIDKALKKTAQSSTPDLFQQACKLASVLLEIHEVFLSRVVGAPGETKSKFGPLGLGIQVQAAIALDRAAGEPMRLSMPRLPATGAALQGAQDACIKQLLAEPEAKRCFKPDGTGVSLARGFPEYRSRTLEEWLLSTLDLLQDRHGVRFLAPYARGKLSSKPKEWGDLVRGNPQLRDWSDLMSVSELLHYFRNSPAEVFRPRYTVLPRIDSTEPGLAQVRALGLAGLVRPTSGQQFLVITMHDLELRALALVLRDGYNPCPFADMVAQGHDPVLFTAAKVAGKTLPDLEALQSNDPVLYHRCLCVARAALFAVPRGFGVLAMLEIARSGFNVEMDLPEATRLMETMNNSYSDLKEYLLDDAGNLLAANLGTTDKAIGNLLEFQTDRRWNDSMLRKNFRAFRKGEGTLDERVGISLNWRNANPAIAELLKTKTVGPELYRALFGKSVCTPTGRVRGQLVYSEARQAAYLDLADDAAKVALYDLVAADYRLAGFVDDEIILEVPDACPDLSQQAERVVSGALQRVLVGIPVRCTSRISCSWPMPRHNLPRHGSRTT